MQTYFATGDEHRRGALTLLVLATLAAAVVGSSGLDGAAVATPSFTIQNDQFIRDGKPFQIMSACVHYFRIRPEYWVDRWVGWTLACKGSRDSWVEVLGCPVSETALQACNACHQPCTATPLAHHAQARLSIE